MLTLALLAASAGCVLMFLLRLVATGSIRHSFLLWNLFLAWDPYVLSLVIFRISQVTSHSPRQGLIEAAIGLVWLFFYPNAPYILTDIIHVIRSPAELPLHGLAITANGLFWYDIILNSVFAFLGHILGLISLITLSSLVRERYSGAAAWGFVAAATLLGGYGIYLGRFRGFNSWDVFRHPVGTIEAAVVNLFNLKAVMFSLAFAFFIFLTYLVVWSLYSCTFLIGLFLFCAFVFITQPVQAQTVTVSIPVGNAPIGVAVTPDSRYVYVTKHGDNTVSVINTATNTGDCYNNCFNNPAGVAVSPNSEYAYIANSCQGWFGFGNKYRYENTVSATISVGIFLMGCGFTPNGEYAYVTNGKATVRCR